MGELRGEKCGIFGVYGAGLEASRLVHSGLWALQHRGQESSGIVSSNGRNLYSHKGLGLVAHVYEESDLTSLPGHIAIGHNRYSTSGGYTPLHNQPVTDTDRLLALSHNGNLPVLTKLKSFLKNRGFKTKGLNDSELMYKVLNYYLTHNLTLEEAVKEAWPLFTGAFSMLLMTKNKLAAIRDSFGIRPLSIGKIDSGYVFSSETCALDTIEATYLYDVQPGEMVVVDRNGITTTQIATGEQKLDIFEFVYFARPDSTLLGKSVYEVRKNLGHRLAREFPMKVDVVIPVPDSAIPAALGYASTLKLPMDYGLTKNRYIHRTFISPAQNLRESGNDMKLNVIRSVLQGRSVAVIDDSIVRGTTSKKLVDKLRRAGAKRVHMLVSSPPVKFPDFYGIDTPKQGQLIASANSVQDIQKFIGADSLHYLSYEGLIEAIGVEERKLCTSCFNGVYPIDIGRNSRRITPDIIDKLTYTGSTA